MWERVNNEKVNNQFHRYNLERKDKRSFVLNYGDFGLRALKSGYILNKELKAVNFYLKKNIKKSGQIWYRIYLNRVITKKPIEVRMGKGKGSFYSYGAFVKEGRIILEVQTLNSQKTIKLLKACMLKFKLPMALVSSKI